MLILRNLVVGLALAGAVLAGPAPAASSGDGVVINRPDAPWGLVGEAQTSRSIEDAGVEGGKAIEAVISGQGDPWAAGALHGINKAFKAGDRIVVAAYMKSKTTNGAPARVNMRVETAGAPWTALAEQTISLGPDWTLQKLEFVAAKDQAGDTTQVALHLNTGAQTIYLAPLVVLDQGAAN